MSAVQRYEEIDRQSYYLLNFICGQHSAEPEKAMTGICKAYDKNMQFEVYLFLTFFEFGISFLEFDYDKDMTRI